MKIGIEFECAIYADNEQLIKNLFLRAKNRGWEVGRDGTVRSDENISAKYSVTNLVEIKTKPYNNLKELIKDIKAVFKIKQTGINSYGKSLSEKKPIRIDFNKSTGTHIHFSNGLLTKKKADEWAKIAMEFPEDDKGIIQNISNFDENLYLTPEIYFLRDINTLKEMRGFMIKNCKYASVAKGMQRNYVNHTDNRSRGSINVINNRGKGTIEFRLINLHGVKNLSFIKAIKHQIYLMFKAILLGYDLEEKLLNKKLKDGKYLYKKIGDAFYYKIDERKLELVAISKKKTFSNIINGMKKDLMELQEARKKIIDELNEQGVDINDANNKYLF